VTGAGEAVELRYRRRGAGTPVLLLHPIAMRLEFWTPVAEILSARFEVISVDLRGHGDNPPADGPFTIDDLATDVVGLCAGLALPPACLVGCSMGGMVAQGVALQAPQRVAGLILADTNHTIGEAGAAVMNARADEAMRGLERSLDGDINRWFSEPFRGRDPETVARVRDWVLANDPRTVAYGWRAIAGLAYERRLGAVTAPVLVTTGSLDPASPPDAARRTAAAFPNARYEELAGCGHFSPLERPDLFAALVTRFIDGTVSARRANTADQGEQT
jgi:3-oxoadipate enol-lactonase